MKKVILLILCAALLTGCFDSKTLTPFEQKLATIEPYQTRTEIAQRYYPDIKKELIPSDDYGKLYQFYVNLKNHSRNCGLMTADGKIVVDAGGYAMINYIDEGDGYYILTRGVKSHNDWGYSEETFIAFADGSNISGPFSRLEYIGGGRFRELDYRKVGDGFNKYVGEIDIEGRIIAPLMSVNDNYEEFVIDKGYLKYYYKSLNGGIDLCDLPEYLDRVETTPDGEFKIYLKYSTDMPMRTFMPDNGVICELYNGATVDYRGDRVIITDKSGNDAAFLLDDNYDNFTISGKLLKIGSQIYDFDLNEQFLNLDYGYYDYIGEDMYRYGRGNKTIVQELSSGKIVKPAQHKYPNLLSPGKFIVDGVIYDMDGNSNRVFPEGWSSHIAGNNRLIVWHYPDADAGIYTTGQYGIYNLSGEEILPARYERLEYLRDDLYLAQDNNYSGVIRENGEWLIKIDMLKND